MTIAPISPTSSHAPVAGRRGDLIARGTRADVYAWLPASAPAAEGGGAWVVKVYRGDSSRRSAFALAAALAAVEHRHLIGLAGLTEWEPGQVGVVLPRLSTVTAAHWLSARHVVTAGESVTLLAPILLALLHLERRALDRLVVPMASIGLGDVLFDASGAPVVTGFRLGDDGLGADGPLPASVARALVKEVLASTVGGSTAARATLSALGDQAGEIDELLEVLFEFDAPAPLEAPLADLAVPAPDAAGDHGHPVEAPASEPLVHPLDELLPGLGAARAMADAALRRSPRAAAVIRGMAEIRPRVWAMAGALAVSAVVGVVALGTPDVTGRPGSSEVAPPIAVSSDRVLAASPAPQQSARPGATEIARDDDTTAALLEGDDADGAARTLLTLRAQCLAALDAACLVGVEQEGSPLLAHDRAIVNDPALLRDEEVELRITATVNRLGDSVLYRAQGAHEQPASVLVMRTEAGWRLRSIA